MSNHVIMTCHHESSAAIVTMFFGRDVSCEAGHPSMLFAPL